MDNNSGYGIWYLLIFFFIIMIFIPPLFRVLIPKEENLLNTSIKTLGCKKTETLTGELEGISIDYEIKTLYSGEKISLINFKYLINSSNQLNSNILDKITSKTFNDILELKSIEKVDLIEDGNSISLKFNFLSNDFKNEAKLQKYSQSIMNQKEMYEKENFSCSIN